MITTQDIIKRLTDVFTKNPASNLGKLCAIMAEQISKIQETSERIQQWRDIDQAQGKTLDLIGSNVGQPRGITKDEIYRVLIKSRIARNLSTADINTIIRVLAVALNADYSQIKIREMHSDPTEPQPAAIKIIELPLDKINEAGLSPNQFGRIVKRTVAAGVSVGVIELTGTFSFGDQEPEVVPFIYGSDIVSDQHTINPDTMVPDDFTDFLEMLLGIDIRDGSIFVPEYDANAGFADIDGTIGGYFGAAFVPDDEDLPI